MHTCLTLEHLQVPCFLCQPALLSFSPRACSEVCTGMKGSRCRLGALVNAQPPSPRGATVHASCSLACVSLRADPAGHLPTCWTKHPAGAQWHLCLNRWAMASSGPVAHDPGLASGGSAPEFVGRTIVQGTGGPRALTRGCSAGSGQRRGLGASHTDSSLHLHATFVPILGATCP